VTVLAPGQQVVCTADYTITQGDMDAGGVQNTARATAVDTADTEVVSEDSSADVTANTAPALSVVKSADADSYDAVGDRIGFSFLVANTGNVTLTGVQVAELSFTGTGSLSPIDCPVDVLAPGDDVTCTAGYEITQADLDAGRLDNTASASGQPPAGDRVVADPSTVAVDAVQNASLSVEKTVDAAGADAAGDQVVYSFHVTNTGNVTVSGVSILETAFSGTGALAAPACDVTTLAPGAGVTCTVAYALTQADVDAGQVSNTAVATGTAGADTVRSAASTAGLTVERRPALTLVKSVQAPDPGTIRAGDALTYSFVITNTGNVTITDPGVDEGEFTGTGALGGITCESTDPLLPGAQLVCTAGYTITQDDVDAGELSNTATATGQGPDGTTPPVSDPSTAALPAPANPSLTLVKTTDATAVTRAGQTVRYAFTVTNTGNTTVHDIAVSEDAFSGHGHSVEVACPADDALLPGQIVTCTAEYTTVSGDLDGKPLVNTATVHGTAPDGSAVTSDPSTARIDDVTVATPPSGLPVTGGTIAWSAGVVALGLLAGGAILVILRRRRGRYQD